MREVVLRFAPHYLLFFLMGVEMYSISPLLPTLVAEFDATPARAGLVVAAYVVVYAVLGPPFGFLSDRFPRRSSVLLGAVVFGIGNLLCAAAHSLDLLVAARGVTGIGAALAGPATWAHLAENSPQAVRGRVISVGASVYALGQVLGVPVGTFVASLTGWQWSFAGIGVLVLVTVPALRRCTALSPPPGARELRSMLLPWTDRPIVLALTATLTLQAARLGTFTYVGVLYSQRFGFSLRELGLLGTAIGVATMAGSLSSGWAFDGLRVLRRPEHLIALVAAAGVAVAVPLMVLAPSPVVSIAFLMVWSYFGAAFQAIMQTFLSAARPAQRASVIGWNNSMLNAGVSAGTVVLGAVAIGGTAFWVLPLLLGGVAAGLCLLNLVRPERPAPVGSG